jgi:hypothetical protein
MAYAGPSYTIERLAEVLRYIVECRPAVGMGATVTLWSDSHAYTVIAVSKSGKQITLQRDKAVLLNGRDSGESDALEFTSGGFLGHVEGRQRYRYERDPNGATIKATLRSYTTRWDGKRYYCWRQVGTPTHRGIRVAVGRRAEHYDYNF